MDQPTLGLPEEVRDHPMFQAFLDEWMAAAAQHLREDENDDPNHPDDQVYQTIKFEHTMH